MRRCNPHLTQLRQRKAALLPQVARLAVEGLTCREIAAQLGVSKTSVNYWLQKLRPDQAAGASQELAETARRRVARYNSIYRRAIQAWGRSQDDKQIQVVEQSGDAGNPAAKQKKSTRTETRPGDAILLAKAMDALRAIDELELRQTAAAGPERRPLFLSDLTVDDLNNLSDEQLATLKARLVEKFGGDDEAPSSPPPPEQQEPDVSRSGTWADTSPTENCSDDGVEP